MADPEKRYQVFVSSTFEDLQKERQEVMQALLELDCIPAGMELFPAADEEQWELIKQVINDCDYYVLIVGGRYGSIGNDGYSYTEMEYRYAVERKMPVIGFVHSDPGSLPAKKTEQTADGKEKLEEFISLVKSKMCKQWSSAGDLGSVVSRSIVKLIKSHPAVGWVRADKALSGEASAEMLRLKNRVEELEEELKSTRVGPPTGTEELSQGDNEIVVPVRLEIFKIDNKYSTEYKWERFVTTWNSIFASISPSMIDDASEVSIRDALDSFAAKETYSGFRKESDYENRRFKAIIVSDEIFTTIIVQFKALGLISKSTRKRSLKDTKTYWSLTPYGDAVMTRLRAIKRQ